MENVNNQEIKETKKKEAITLIRYDEIDKKLEEAISKHDDEMVLFLNELTLARNLETTKRFKQDYSVVSVAFKKDNGIMKRAGVYNVNEYQDPEEVEDILINEDWKNKKILVVPRNSLFISLLK